MKPNLSIAEIHGLPEYVSRFRIVEKVTTVDGPRDRFTSQAFDTLEQATAYIYKLTKAE